MSIYTVVACFAAGTLFVLAAYSLIDDLAEKRGQDEQGKSPEPISPTAKSPIDIDQLSRSDKPASRTPRLDAWRLWIHQAGVEIRLEALLGLSSLIGILPAGVTFFFSGHAGPAAIAYLLSSLLPFAFIAIKRQRRCDRLREQLPDALDLMSRMLRAGQTVTQSLRAVADEFETPIAEEFGYCYEHQNLGLSADASLSAMARRTGVLELRILVVALTVHRHSGGNLSELLDSLAFVIRDRYRIHGQIRALTADGRLQASILLALPPFLLGVLSLLNHDYVTVLFQYPSLFIGLFTLELIGAIWLRRIVSFDF